MSPSMSLGQSQRQTVSQTQRLSQAQRLAAQNILLERRRDLIYRLTGDQLNPRATCSRCDHRLTPAEILQGFIENVSDFTTRCTKCGARFLPKLTREDGYSTIEVAYYCAAQALNMLRGAEYSTPAQLRSHSAALYHSTIVHFGTLKNAFAKLGIAYQYEEAEPSWREKVRNFLGLLPDTEIAQCAGVSASSVRRFRKSLYIAPFRKADLHDELF